MRVLMLSKACIVGIYQRKLEYIAQQGVDLLVLVPPSWQDERGEQTLERVYTEGYRLQETPIHMNGNFHFHFYPHLGDYMSEFRPDIVHIDEEAYNVATWHALFLANMTATKTLFFSWQNIKRNYPPPFSWGERWVMKHVDYALVGTDSAGEVLQQKGYQGRLATIPQFGTDEHLFQPQPLRTDRPFTIGYIGRLVEEKGVDLLLMAAARLSGDWRVRIVGSGPLRAELDALTHELGIADRVIFIDWVASTDMPQQYEAIDVLVLPSLTRPNWKEQFGRVIVEAMATARPVIGSDSGAIRGVIGSGGLVFPEGDVAALTEHLHTLQTKADLRLILGDIGRKRVLEHFTHERIAAATVKVYHEICQSDSTLNPK
ncbi:MAG: glycosyltransferase family 4 protein [Anaerolineae bacterium]|nr:glycosyltransferase family 4 protein [Anaerolineae bacterium]MDQ7035287.1 glycosyltransferase family 4 protein [Anaerolineae bacterium]